MGDVDVGEVELVLQLQHQLQDLGPHAHVEHRDRLVGDQDVRLQDDCPGQRDALLLTAREVSWVLAHELAGRREADPLERGDDLGLGRLRVVGHVVELEGVKHGGADRHRRVERCMGVLEDDLESLAELAEALLLEAGDLLAVEDDRAALGLDQAQKRAAERRLAGAGLADHAEDLAAADVERGVVDGLDRTGLAPAQAVVERSADAVGRAQIANLEEGRWRSWCSCFLRGGDLFAGERLLAALGDLVLGTVEPALDPLR